jgi:hypothetical protein
MKDPITPECLLIWLTWPRWNWNHPVRIFAAAIEPST